MADIVKSTSSLKLLAAFADEDDRTITVNNPQPNITAGQIHSLASLAENVIIGDKYGAEFTRFKSATYVDKVVTEVDLSL